MPTESSRDGTMNHTSGHLQPSGCSICPREHMQPIHKRHFCSPSVVPSRCKASRDGTMNHTSGHLQPSGCSICPREHKQPIHKRHFCSPSVVPSRYKASAEYRRLHQPVQNIMHASSFGHCATWSLRDIGDTLWKQLLAEETTSRTGGADQKGLRPHVHVLGSEKLCGPR